MNKNIVALMLGAGAIAAVCSILIMRWILPPPASGNEQPVKVKITLEYDSIRPTIIIPPANAAKPDIIIPPKQETINYYLKADSALIRSIVEEHFRIKVYSDTLRDSTIEAIINTTISQNHRDEFTFSYRKLTPSVTHQNIYQPISVKNMILGGAYFMIHDGKLEPGLSAAIINKKRHMFGIQKDAGNFKWNDGWGAQYMVSF